VPAIEIKGELVAGVEAIVRSRVAATVAVDITAGHRARTVILGRGKLLRVRA